MKRILIKKIIPLFCAGILLCTPQVTAYATAGDIAEETHPAEETLPEELAAEENTEQTSYSVEIAWGSLKLDYTPLWNPEEHCYDGWESTENPITVTNTTENGSPIQVTLTFVPIEQMSATAVFSHCKDDPNPDDFVFSDGQVSFLLPRDAGGETQATVNLFMTGEPVNWDSEQYNQIGTIKTEILPLSEPGSSIEEEPTEIPEQPILPDPSEPETLPAQPSEAETFPAQPSEAETLPAQPSEAETLPAQPSEPETLPVQPSEAETLPAQPSEAETLPAQPSQPETLPVQPSEPNTPTESESKPSPSEEEQPSETEKAPPSEENTPDEQPQTEDNAKEESQAASAAKTGALSQEEPE